MRHGIPKPGLRMVKLRWEEYAEPAGKGTREAVGRHFRWAYIMYDCSINAFTPWMSGNSSNTGNLFGSCSDPEKWKI